MKRLGALAFAVLFATLFVVSATSAQVPIYQTDNLLVIGNWNTDLGSSDEVTVVQLEASGTILVDEGHPVKYFQNKTPTNLAGVTDWMLPGFDDSGWLDGQNAVGYNSSQITSVPDNDDQGAIYSRFAPFDIPNAPSVGQLTIRADYDDGFIAWLNGVEIVRANMGTDDAVPEWNHSAVSHESTNKPGPDASRWSEPVSNLFGAGDDNPSGSIVEYTFDVVFSGVSAAVEPAGKLAATWGNLKRSR